MASASGYNHHRFARSVLKKSRKWEPSLSVELHPAYWKFADSPVNFPYDGPLRPFLLALRSQVIPASLISFLYDIQPPISFVDGCLVVEIEDKRRIPDVKTRVVMRPAAESLAQTIDQMLERRGERWDEGLALELESRIIDKARNLPPITDRQLTEQSATSPPLYLGTSLLATRNAVLSMTLTSPATPHLSADGQIRRPTAQAESSTSASDRMRKLLRASERRSGVNISGGFAPNWSILRLKERIAALERQQAADREARAAAAAVNGIGGMGNGWGNGLALDGLPHGNEGGGGGAGGEDGGEPVKKKKKKRPPPEEEDEGEEEKAPAKGSKKKKTAATAGVGKGAAGATATPDKGGKGGKGGKDTGKDGGKDGTPKVKIKVETKEDKEDKPKKKPKKKKAEEG